jgi:hypothetical protein
VLSGEDILLGEAEEVLEAGLAGDRLVAVGALAVVVAGPVGNGLVMNRLEFRYEPLGLGRSCKE